MRFYLFLLICLLISCTSIKNPSQDKQTKIQQVTGKIQDKDFVIEVTQAQPMRGRTINLTFGYDLKIKNDSAIAYLPYFGVAQIAPYGGGDGGIKFAEQMKNYQISPMKKGDGWNIKFNVNTFEYNYEFILNIFNNGNSSVIVNSYERDLITFHGNIKLN